MLKKAGKPDKEHAQVVKRAPRKHHEEAHGGAWKVAFADFCLALLALFLVLWLMAAREKEEMQKMLLPSASRLNEGKGRMPDSDGGPRGSMIDTVSMLREPALPTQPAASAPVRPADAPKVRYDSAADLQALSRVLAQFSADAGLSSNLQTVVTAYGLRVMLHDTDKQGMFERGSATPSARFQALLRKMGPLFAQMENQMLVVGHTDSVQYADRSHAAYSNWTLSSDRAMAARAQLMAGGMPGSGVLQVVGMADRAPLDTAHATAGVNRRIELLILTGAQAGTIARMFGLPGTTQPLADGVESELPDYATLQALRNRILQSKGGKPNASS